MELLMPSVSAVLLYSLLWSVQALTASSSAEQCKPNGLCKAKCKGVDIDISEIFDHKIIALNDPVYVYKVNCSGFLCSNVPNSGVCQYNQDDSLEWSVGIVTPGNVAWYLNSSTDFTVIYSGGNDSRLSYIDFHADDNFNSPNISFIIEGHNVDYYFEIRSSNIGMKRTDSTQHISGVIGFFLIGVAAFGFITYFIIGVFIMYSVKGARGLELIPNYIFWRSLPGLVKDGFLFTISPLTKRMGYTTIE